MSANDTQITFPSKVRVNGDLVVDGAMPAYSRAQLLQDNNLKFPIPPHAFRIWDEFARALPDLSAGSAIVVASGAWDPNLADVSFFVANRDYRVIGITARIEVAGTDGSAVTGAVKKAASGTDIAAGTALHSSTINLKGTVNTNQALTVSTTYADLDIPAGTAIGLDLTGTPTAARGVVSVFLVPISPDDLAVTAGVFGTGCPNITTGDVKNVTVAGRKARVQVQLPECYVTGQSVALRISGGMVTTVASSLATVDVECYKLMRDTLITGTDLCENGAQSINSLVFADKDFNFTPTTLNPGDWLDIVITVAVTDVATVTAVIAALGAVELLCDCQG